MTKANTENKPLSGIIDYYIARTTREINIVKKRRANIADGDAVSNRCITDNMQSITAEDLNNNHKFYKNKFARSVQKLGILAWNVAVSISPPNLRKEVIIPDGDKNKCLPSTWEAAKAFFNQSKKEQKSKPLVGNTQQEEQKSESLVENPQQEEQTSEPLVENPQQEEEKSKPLAGNPQQEEQKSEPLAENLQQEEMKSDSVHKLETILTEKERKEYPILSDLVSSETFRQEWDKFDDVDKISVRALIKKIVEVLGKINHMGVAFLDMHMQTLESDIEIHKENNDPDIWEQIFYAKDQEEYNHSMMRVKEGQRDYSIERAAKIMYFRMQELYPNAEEFSENVSKKQFSEEFIKTLATRYMTHFLKLPKVVHKADQPILSEEEKEKEGKGSPIPASSLSMMLRFQGNKDPLSQKMTEHMAHLTELSVYQSNLFKCVMNGAQEQSLKKKCQKILERDGMMFLPISPDRHAMYGVLTRNAEGGLDFTMQNTWKGEGRLTATIRGGDDEERLTNIMHILRGSVKPSADYNEGAKRMLETMTFGKVEDGSGKKAFGGKSINDIFENLQESETILHTGQVQGNCHIIGLVHALGIAAELNEKRPESAPRIEGLTALTMKRDVQKLQYSDPDKAAKAFVRAVKRQATPEARIERIKKTKEELDTVEKDFKGWEELREDVTKNIKEQETGYVDDKIVGLLEELNIPCSSLEAKKKKLEDRLKTLEIRQKLSKLANREDVKKIPELRKALFSKSFEDLLKQDPTAYDSLEDYTTEALSKMMAYTK